VRHQNNIVYRPVDVSESALIEASKAARKNIPGVDVHYQVADYTREPLSLDRLAETRILALYIGSSIGISRLPKLKRFSRTCGPSYCPET